MIDKEDAHKDYDRLIAQIGVKIDELRLDFMAMSQIAEDLKNDMAGHPGDYPYLNGIQVSWGNGALKFLIPEHPPTVRKIGRYGAIERERWLRGIVEAYQRSGLNLRFTSVHVTIGIFLPTSCRWDADNRSIKPIFDALRYLKLIRDDTWDTVHAYTVIPGVDKDNPRTEIYVSESTDKSPEKTLLELTCF